MHVLTFMEAFGDEARLKAQCACTVQVCSSCERFEDRTFRSVSAERRSPAPAGPRGSDPAPAHAGARGYTKTNTFATRHTVHRTLNFALLPLARPTSLALSPEGSDATVTTVSYVS